MFAWDGDRFGLRYHLWFGGFIVDCGCKLLYLASGWRFRGEELLDVVPIEGFDSVGVVFGVDVFGVSRMGHVRQVCHLLVKGFKLIRDNLVGCFSPDVFLNNINSVKDMVGVVINLLLKDEV